MTVCHHNAKLFVVCYLGQLLNLSHFLCHVYNSMFVVDVTTTTTTTTTTTSTTTTTTPRIRLCERLSYPDDKDCCTKESPCFHGEVAFIIVWCLFVYLFRLFHLMLHQRGCFHHLFDLFPIRRMRLWPGKFTISNKLNIQIKHLHHWGKQSFKKYRKFHPVFNEILIFEIVS